MSVFGLHAPFLITLVMLVQLPLMALGSIGILLGESGVFLTLLVASASLLATPFWIGAMLHALRRMQTVGEIEITEAYRVSLLLFPRTLPAFMLSMLAVMCGGLLFMIPGIFLGVSPGIFLGMIAGIFLGVKLSMVNCVALFERHEPLGALRQAWKLSNGYSLEVLGYLCILGGPVIVMTALESLLVFSEPAPATVALFTFVSQLVFVVLSIIYLILVYEVYMAASRSVAVPPPLPAAGDSMNAGADIDGPSN